MLAEGEIIQHVKVVWSALADVHRALHFYVDLERSVPSKASWWGYGVIQIDDPDGNELLFPT